MKNNLFLLIILFNIIQIFAGGMHSTSNNLSLLATIDTGNLKKIERALKKCIDVQDDWVKNLAWYNLVKHYPNKINDIEPIGILLDKYGLDINIQDQYGKTALHWASLHGKWEIVPILINLGAWVNVCDDHDYTPLIEASRARSFANEEDCVKVIECLIKAGAKLNKKDKNGNTALMNAASALEMNIKIINLLIQNGADMNSVNNKGFTFFDYIEHHWLFRKICKERRLKEIYETISKQKGLNEDMPDNLLDIISGYETNDSY